MKITICGSTEFVKEMFRIKKILEEKGYEVLMPHSAQWFLDGKANLQDLKDKKEVPEFKKKYNLIRKHFEEVFKGDAILVLNYDRDKIKNYVGGNTFAEISVAYYLNKPIYLINPIPGNLPYTDELEAMEPVVLNGNLDLIKNKQLPSAT